MNFPRVFTILSPIRRVCEPVLYIEYPTHRAVRQDNTLDCPPKWGNWAHTRSPAQILCLQLLQTAILPTPVLLSLLSVRYRITQATLTIVAAVLLCYLVDVVQLRVRGLMRAISSVTVRQFYAVHHKDGRTELLFQPPENQPCAQSLFPQKLLSMLVPTPAS